MENVTDTTTTDTTTTTTAPEAKPVGRPRKMSEKVLARARQMYADGKSVPEIAKQVWCNVGKSALYYHLGGKSPKGDGAVDMRRRGRKGLSEEQVARLVELYQGDEESEPMTLSAIRLLPEFSWRKGGKDRHFALPTLSKALKEQGIEPRRGRPASAVEEEAEEEAAAEAAE